MNSLVGKKILVTRSVEQSAEFSELLKSYGAEPIIFPCIEIKYLNWPQGLKLEDFDWVFFTSQNGVRACVIEPSPDLGKPSSPRIGCVGPKTAKLVKELLGVKASFIPSDSNSKSLADEFEQPPQKILLIQGILAPDCLGQALSQKRHQVRRLNLYETLESVSCESLAESIDAITFLSPSAVKSFSNQTKQPAGTYVACVGKTTYQAARQLGFKNLVYAKEPSLDSLIQMLQECFSESDA